MKPEQIQKMADGLPPSCIGKDHEEVITWLAKMNIALQQQVTALAAENAELMKFCKNAAFDAYLNSVRADGVEQAARKIQEHVWDESEGYGIVAAIYALEIIAAQLRAGEQGGDHV